MRQHHGILGAVAVLVLLGAYAFMPRVEEHATMLARDGLYESALREVTALPRNTSRQPQVLMQIYMLREKEGNYADAVATLNEYLALRPGDEVARERYAKLLLTTGDLASYLIEARTLTAMHPDAKRIELLASLYRLHGYFAEELDLLHTYARTAHLDSSLNERLGSLLAARGDWRGALEWLSHADRAAPDDQSYGRLLLLDVLLRDNQRKLALQKAKSWIAKWRSAFLTVKLIVAFADAGETEATAELAEVVVSLMPEKVFDIVGALTRRERPQAARTMLASWSTRAVKSDRDQWREYIYAVLQLGDYGEPFQLLARLTRSGAAPLMRACLAEEIAAAMGMQALEPLRQYLTNEVLKTRPLFAGQLAQFEGNAQLSLHYLTTARLVDLTPHQRMAWLVALRKVESTTAVFQRLTRLWVAKQLPPEYYQLLAEEARQRNNNYLYSAIWSSLDK